MPKFQQGQAVLIVDKTVKSQHLTGAIERVQGEDTYTVLLDKAEFRSLVRKEWSENQLEAYDRGVEEHWLPLPEAMRRTRYPFGIESLRRQVRSGQIHAKKEGRTWLVSLTSMQEHAARFPSCVSD